MQAIPIASGTTDIAVISNTCDVWGFVVTEDAGTPAASSIDFSFGTSSGEEIWFPLNFAADETVAVFFPAPLHCEGGVFINRTGTIKGTLFIR